MDHFSKQFKTWMDERGLTSETIAPLMQKEEGTIRNWRSRGVPTRQSVRLHVAAFMFEFDNEHQPNEPETAPPLDILNLEVPPEKLDAWNKAALDQGKIIRDWAIQGLDALAREELPRAKGYDFQPQPPHMAAEDTMDFNKRIKDLKKGLEKETSQEGDSETA